MSDFGIRKMHKPAVLLNPKSEIRHPNSPVILQQSREPPGFGLRLHNGRSEGMRDGATAFHGSSGIRKKIARSNDRGPGDGRAVLLNVVVLDLAY